MARVIPAFLRNEHFGLQDSLDELDKLGGVYIKFLQIAILSSRGIQQSNFNERLKVYEDSIPDKINAWQHLMKFGMPNMNHIARMDPQPFATGSFGQVYKAQLVTGEQVIIKLLRPSVMKYLRYDLRLLQAFCYAYSFIDRQKMFNFKQVYKKFKLSCLQ